MKKSRFTDSQIIAVLKQAEAGTPVPELCRGHGNQLGYVLQMAQQVRRHGGIHGRAHEGAGGGEPAAEEDVRRGPAQYRPAEGSARKKMVRPSQRREMAQSAVTCGRTSIRHACQTFAVSETCFRYKAKASEENARIADWLVRLTTVHRDWGFGLCYLYLRNVKCSGWNPSGSTGSTVSWS